MSNTPRGERGRRTSTRAPPPAPYPSSVRAGSGERHLQTSKRVSREGARSVEVVYHPIFDARSSGQRATIITTGVPATFYLVNLMQHGGKG